MNGSKETVENVSTKSTILLIQDRANERAVRSFERVGIFGRSPLEELWRAAAIAGAVVVDGGECE